MIKNLRLLIIALMSSPFSFANGQQIDLDRGIYFCTKDIDMMQSSPASVTGSNLDNEGKLNLQAYYPLKNNQHNTLNLRHCFVVFGDLVKRDDSKLYLADVKPYGYGVDR